MAVQSPRSRFAACPVHTRGDMLCGEAAHWTHFAATLKQISPSSTGEIQTIPLWTCAFSESGCLGITLCCRPNISMKLYTYIHHIILRLFQCISCLSDGYILWNTFFLRWILHAFYLKNQPLEHAFIYLQLCSGWYEKFCPTLCWNYLKHKW